MDDSVVAIMRYRRDISCRIPYRIRRKRVGLDWRRWFILMALVRLMKVKREGFQHTDE